MHLKCIFMLFKSLHIDIYGTPRGQKVNDNGFLSGGLKPRLRSRLARETPCVPSHSRDRYLVLNGGDVALVPPVDGTGSLQEVGLHEEGSGELPLSFALVAVHELPELLVRLKREDNKRGGGEVNPTPRQNG